MDGRVQCRLCFHLGNQCRIRFLLFRIRCENMVHEYVVDDKTIEDIAGSENIFAKGRVKEDVGSEYQGEERCVAVGVSGVGTARVRTLQGVGLR